MSRHTHTDQLYSGSLQIEFQYEVGNDIFLNAQKIESGNPENDMMAVLLDSTTLLVEEVVAETFRRRGLRSSVADVRVLRVTYSTGTTSIGNLTDIREFFDPKNNLLQPVSLTSRFSPVQSAQAHYPELHFARKCFAKPNCFYQMSLNLELN
jgi:hypothetical protein